MKMNSRLWAPCYLLGSLHNSEGLWFRAWVLGFRVLRFTVKGWIPYSKEPESQSSGATKPHKHPKNNPL